MITAIADYSRESRNSGNILLRLTLPLVAQQPASDANRTRSLTLPRSKPRTGHSQRTRLPEQVPYPYLTMQAISIVEDLREPRFANDAKRKKHASLLQ